MTREKKLARPAPVFCRSAEGSPGSEASPPSQSRHTTNSSLLRRSRYGAYASRVTQTTSGHYRRPKPLPQPNPQPKPGSYPLLGRRGSNEDARRQALPTVDPHGTRARPSVAPQTTKPIDSANLWEPIRLPHPIPHGRSGGCH
jgi:hypothetical protein